MRGSAAGGGLRWRMGRGARPGPHPGPGGERERGEDARAVPARSTGAGQSGMPAVTVISMSSSGALSEATVTVVRAGFAAGK